MDHQPDVFFTEEEKNMAYCAGRAPLVFVIPDMQKNHFNISCQSVIFLSDRNSSHPNLDASGTEDKITINRRK